MSKNDGDRDETPIQFSIPRIYSRGGRVPAPLNQPHWKYKSNTSSRPTFGVWLFVILFELFMGALAYLALTEITNASKWMVAGLAAVIFVAIPWFVLQHFLAQDRQGERTEDEESERKAKRKQPKQRKDYR